MYYVDNGSKPISYYCISALRCSNKAKFNAAPQVPKCVSDWAALLKILPSTSFFLIPDRIASPLPVPPSWNSSACRSATICGLFHNSLFSLILPAKLSFWSGLATDEKIQTTTWHKKIAMIACSYAVGPGTLGTRAERGVAIVLVQT